MLYNNAVAELRRCLLLGKDWGALSSSTQPFPANLKEHTCEALVRWFTEAAPVGVSIPWFAGRLELYDPVEVWDRQVGFRSGVGAPDTVVAGWHANWLVIGDASGDPIIVDYSKPQAPVMMAVHGVGSWAPKLIADDLAEFLTTLVRWLDIWQSLSGRIRDEEGVLFPKVSSAVSNNMLAHLSPECRGNYLEFLG